MVNAEQIIEKLGLTPLSIEGGWFKRIYTANESTNSIICGGRRPLSSTIYYLLKRGECSKLHSLKQEEQWLFLKGSPIKITLLSADEKTEVIMGGDLEQGQTLHQVIPAGTIFGAEMIDEIIDDVVDAGQHDYSLLAAICTPA